MSYILLKEDQGGRKIVNNIHKNVSILELKMKKNFYDIDYQNDLQKLIKEEEYD